MSKQAGFALVSASITKPRGGNTPLVALTGKYDITPEPLRYGWLPGPAYANSDAVLFKNFRLTKTLRFESRTEVNNVAKWATPRTDMSNPRTLGTIDSGGNPRSLRLTVPTA